MNPLAAQLTRLLIAQQSSITFMESCTSGLLASWLTDTEGASAVFKGSWVTYSNAAKIAAGLPEELIATQGVYSLACAAAMAKTVQEAFAAEVAVGVTGSTGNIDSNNADSVQGQLYYCIRVGTVAYSYRYQLAKQGLSRAEIKQRYAEEIYQRLWALLSPER